MFWRSKRLFATWSSAEPAPHLAVDGLDAAGEVPGVARERDHRGFGFELYGPDHPPPDLYSPVLSTEPLGDYPLVFDYKRAVFQQDNLELEVWAMLFWDKIIGFMSFHGPECGCAECATPTARA